MQSSNTVYLLEESDFFHQSSACKTVFSVIQLLEALWCLNQPTMLYLLQWEAVFLCFV